MLRPAVFLAAALLLLLAPACGPGPDPDSDAGPNVEDGGTDGGLTDGGDPDGGPADGGCTDPSCVPCEDGGTLCPDGTTCDQGACVGTCTPGATACDGVMALTCEADGLGWGPAEPCSEGSLCREDACVSTATCVSETPSCCSMPAECGSVVTPFACPECRPIVRDGYCVAGACEAAPADTADVTIIGDATALSANDQLAVKTIVVTVYRPVDSVGRRVDCAFLLGDGTGDGPHDAQDPRLDATLSKYFAIMGGTGTDQFQAAIFGLPTGQNQTVVFSAYSDVRGGGRLLGRGCAEGYDPAAGGAFAVTLTP